MVGSSIYTERRTREVVDGLYDAYFAGDPQGMLATMSPNVHMRFLGRGTFVGIEAATRSFAEEQELKLGKVAQPLRAALTGRTVSPGVFEVMVLLGRNEALARLSDQAENA